MVTEGAFFSGLRFWADEAHAVRTGLDTVTTPDTVLRINENNTILRPVSGTNRTDLNAWRLFTLVTDFRNEKGLENLLI